MRLITVSGPPSSGKTLVVIRAVEQMGGGEKVMVVKFDCLSSTDQERYQRAGIRAVTGLSGNQCPDHFYISNVEDCAKRAQAEGFEYLIVESAGLCNRCAPHLKDCLAVCVIDNLSGVNTPHKIGPMLRFADVVAVTKGDIVSQADREVFSFKVKLANSRAGILFVNGITGQGAFDLAREMKLGPELGMGLAGRRLRFTMPSALCSYCLGETRVGEEYLKGNYKKMKWD